jgi:GntR family transcriptional repressor for pyruvate dehydrogenase complex
MIDVRDAPMAIANTKSKCDIVVDELMAMFARGEYKQGDKILPENLLADRFGVSRITVREAVKRLAALGLVTIKWGDGTYVNNINIGSAVKPMLSNLVFDQLNIRQIYDARMFVEAGTARLAARNRTEEELLELKRLLDDMRTAFNPYDYEKFSFYDTKFHELIGRISDNPILTATYSAIQDVLYIYIKKTNVSMETAKRSMEHHTEIISYISERNEYLAGITMERHVEHAKFSLLQQYDK